MEIVAYTLWENATGEIIGDGTSVRDKAFVPENSSVWYGEALSRHTHVFNADGIPIERSSPVLRTQRELQLEINHERDRRILAGKDFGGIWVTGSDRDQLNLLALKDTARDLQAAGVTASVIPFRDGNNVEHALTADQIIDIANAGKAYVSAIYQASWALKAMDPIPQDVTNDALWP